MPRCGYYFQYIKMCTAGIVVLYTSKLKACMSNVHHNVEKR